MLHDSVHAASPDCSHLDRDIYDRPRGVVGCVRTVLRTVIIILSGAAAGSCGGALNSSLVAPRHGHRW